MNKKTRSIQLVSFAVASALVLTACGAAGSKSENGGSENTIRFTFAPDPVWDYIADEGILAEMEEERGMRIIASSTWDEFGVFAGGHADVVSTASYEIPIIEKETGRDTLTIGRYNKDRSVVITRADNPAETLEDLVGEDIVVFTAVSATLVWGAYAKQMHDLDFRTGGGDFNLIVADPQNQADLVERGEVAACVCLPEFAAPGLRSGELKVLYDGKASADIYSEQVVEGHEGPMINVFLAGSEWAREYPEEVQFFLDVWQRGLEEWSANQEKIVESYPQHFAVEEPEDVEFVQKYIADHDWFVDDIRFDSEWVEGESQIFDLLQSTGFMDKDQNVPEFLATDE